MHARTRHAPRTHTHTYAADALHIPWQGVEAWQREVGALTTHEWVILCHSGHEDSYAHGLSACLPDEVRDARSMEVKDKPSKALLAQEKEWILNLGEGSIEAHAILLRVLRTLSQRRFAAPAPALHSLAGATLLGRGRGGGGRGGGLLGLSTPPPGIKPLTSATAPAHSLRPRAAATAPAAVDASAAAPPSAKASRSASKLPKADPPGMPPGTPPGFTYLYSVGDICKHSKDGNRRVEIIEVGTYTCTCTCTCTYMHIHMTYTCMCILLWQCKAGKYRVKAASGIGESRGAEEGNLTYICTAVEARAQGERAEQACRERERIQQERSEQARTERERTERERTERERTERERTERERTERERTERERTERERTEREGSEPPLPPLPPGWCAVPSTAGTYYYHETTRETTWTRPTSVPPPPPPPPLPPPPPPPPLLPPLASTPNVEQQRQRRQAAVELAKLQAEEAYSAEQRRKRRRGQMAALERMSDL